MKDDFVWHKHDDEDELFMVFKGTLLMDFRDGRTVEVGEGEILIVPKGVEHRPELMVRLFTIFYLNQKVQLTLVIQKVH